MKKISVRLSILFLTSLFISSVAACSSSPADDNTDPDIEIPDQSGFMDAFEMNRTLGKGVNLGNALEAPNEGDWGMVIEEHFIERINEAGFDHVRVPIRWNAHAGNTPPYTIESAFFNRVDQIINWSLDRGLAVMINIHHYDEMMQNPQQHRERFLAIWDQIATHYKQYPEELVFEVMNEPHDNFTSDVWNSYLLQAINQIRQANPRRIVVAGTANWGGFGSLPELQLPENDRQIITTVHYYSPFQFTHQGAEWAGPDADEWLGTTWDGTDQEKADIDNDFDDVYAWALDNNRPIHLGEFGAYSTADDESRVRWTRTVREAAEQREFSWAYWEFGAGFGVYNRNAGEWRKNLLEALIP